MFDKLQHYSLKDLFVIVCNFYHCKYVEIMRKNNDEWCTFDADEREKYLTNFGPSQVPFSPKYDISNNEPSLGERLQRIMY